jgi:hypothetical protein
LEFFGEGIVGGLKCGETHGCKIATFVAGFEGFADLIPAYIGAVAAKYCTIKSLSNLLGCIYFYFCVGDKMIDNAPLFIVPL